LGTLESGPHVFESLNTKGETITPVTLLYDSNFGPHVFESLNTKRETITLVTLLYDSNFTLTWEI
jgi:hypothetical protein